MLRIDAQIGRPRGPRPLPAASPSPKPAPGEVGGLTGRELTAWQLVFDRLDANPLELQRLRGVCRDFDALSGHNLLWLPYARLEDLGLAPPRLVPEPPAIVATCIARRRAGDREDYRWQDLPEGRAWAESAPAIPGVFWADDLQAAGEQEAAVAAGLQPSAFHLPALPAWLGKPANHGLLRRAFLARADELLRNERAHVYGADRVRRAVVQMWSQPIYRGPVLEGFRETYTDNNMRLCAEVHELAQHYRDNWLLMRAAVDRLELNLMPYQAPLAIQAEPAFFAPWYAQSGGHYGNARAPAITLDLEGFWRTARTDESAYRFVHPGLQGRLDVAVWALAHAGGEMQRARDLFAPRMAPIVWGATQAPADMPVDFQALQAAVPAESPIWRRPQDAALLRSINDWSALYRLGRDVQAQLARREEAATDA